MNALRTARITLARRNKALVRAFTLVELLIAMAAGLLVALGAFILSKNATAFFQHESRIASAQLSAAMGMQRIIGDLQRAAFLSTANIQRDPMRCGSPATWPAGLNKLAGIQLTLGGSVTGHPMQLTQSTQAPNNLNPDSIVIGGSFDSTEQFPVRAILPGGAGGVDVYLQTDTASMKRALATAQPGAELAKMQEIFRVNRFLRLVDLEGKTEWGVIAAVAVNGSPVTSVIVSTKVSPAVQQRTPGTTCGYTGLGIGVLANVVSRVRYDLRSLQGVGAFAPVVAPISPAVSGDNGRTELVRVELKDDDTEDAATMELIAEYAVDLKFGISTATTGNNPVISRFPIASPEIATVYSVAGDVTAGGTPERIRSVQVRLSTRSRTGDRDADISMAPFSPPDGRRLRFLIDATLPRPNYARLRMHYADVNIANQVTVQW